MGTSARSRFKHQRQYQKDCYDSITKHSCRSKRPSNDDWTLRHHIQPNDTYHYSQTHCLQLSRPISF
ncbi:hypothetical protein K457DRAFT_142675 [Linnemannia elongata AG-77]|uniref:Uncharacterized protein n=1 Tax=Linnemannia elongata AG-77 TaxID=1314771 RepID=A0A197JE91_9FUNG|nr:hypothetical protein K457DRAFT_142675 [Linnemannia elongata AG-77]